MNVRAAVAPSVGADFEISTVTLDDPGLGEIAVEIAGVGICHTDIAVRDGHLPFPLPGVLGHEGSGVVTAVAAHERFGGPLIVIDFGTARLSEDEEGGVACGRSPLHPE